MFLPSLDRLIEASVIALLLTFSAAHLAKLLGFWFLC
jgi:hypothetical protein